MKRRFISRNSVSIIYPINRLNINPYDCYQLKNNIQQSFIIKRDIITNLTEIKRIKKEYMLTQLYPTLCDPLDCSPPGSSVHGIFPARILECIAISSSRGSSLPRDWTHDSCVSCTVDGFFTHLAIREAPQKNTMNNFMATNWTTSINKYLQNHKWFNSRANRKSLDLLTYIASKEIVLAI